MPSPASSARQRLTRQTVNTATRQSAHSAAGRLHSMTARNTSAIPATRISGAWKNDSTNSFYYEMPDLWQNEQQHNKTGRPKNVLPRLQGLHNTRAHVHRGERPIMANTLYITECQDCGRMNRFLKLPYVTAYFIAARKQYCPDCKTQTRQDILSKEIGQ